MSDLKYEKVSADEVQAKRQEFMGDNGSLVKATPMLEIQTKGSSWNNDERSAIFTMSAEAPDRMGDIVVQDGLSLDNFSKNPQALLFHNSRSWPIGSWKDVNKNLTGRPKRTEGKMVILAEGVDPDADRAARHIAAGTMRSVSIGFRANWDAVEAIRDADNRWLGYRFLETELLECSLVPIPAMQLALMKEVTPSVLSVEHRELIEMTLDTFARDPVTKQLMRRDELESLHKQASPARTIVIFGSTMSKELLESIQGAEFVVPKGFDFTSRESLIIEGEKAGDPPKPQDGEEVPQKTDPEDGAVKKDAAAGFVTIVREHARESKEPGLFARLLTKLLGPDENIRQEEPVQKENVTTDEPEVTEISQEDKTALEDRVKAILERGLPPAPNAGSAG